jgi:CheY-like chemotaxis protein
MSEKQRILIVDDEPDHLMALRLILEREEHFEILTAGDTVDAELILQKNPVALMILDIALPGESGLEFCHRIKEKEEYRQIPVIALSAYPDDIWRDKALEAGCSEFISKPSEPKDIFEAVKKFVTS